MATTPSVDLELLATFVAVADETSFSKAARRLGVGKGTVSRAIARLETLLDAELLHRTTHRVALSTAGAALYERAAPHLAALRQAVGKLPERDEAPSGELRLTAPHDFGVMVLPEVLAAFGLRYPEIRFDVHLTNAVVDLVAGGFDLAIRVATDKPKDSTLTSRKLGLAVMGHYASPAYLARRGEPRALGEAGHDWVAFSPFVSKAIKAAKAARHRDAQPERPRFQTDELFLIRDLVRAGAGVGSLPTFLAAPFVATGELRPVLAGARGPRGGGPFVVSMLYPSSWQVPRKVRAFGDFLVERLKRAPLHAA
jgi:DNA-binding transcriptional LysR family regulator